MGKWGPVALGTTVRYDDAEAVRGIDLKIDADGPREVDGHPLSRPISLRM